jgi:hypothetical protein
LGHTLQAIELDTESAGHRQQNLYYNQLFQLKVQCEYIRRYREILSRWAMRFSALRAITSSGGIAAWVIWKEYAFLWGTAIAASQLADALKDVIPFTARQKAANALLTDLDALFIEALFGWENVFSGAFTTEEITERRRRLMQLQHELGAKHFPTGDLPQRHDLLALAEQDAIAYLEHMVGDGNAQ